MLKLNMGEWIVLVGSVLIIIFSIVVGTIIYKKPPPVRFTYQETSDTILGEAFYRSQGCAACHELFGNGTAVFGPGLDGIGSRRTVGWLTDYLQNPRPGVSDRPYKLKMEPVELQQQELHRLAQYLSALKEVDLQGNIIEPE